MVFFGDFGISSFESLFGTSVCVSVCVSDFKSAEVPVAALASIKNK